MTQSICIGVPTYRRADNLADVLARLVPLLETRPHIRLCIVNDGSHDAAYEKAIAPYAVRIDYRVSMKNGGCGAARRACFEGAAEKYLVCIDDDCVPTEFWLDWLEAMIEANPGVDLFAGDVRPFFVGRPTPFRRALSVVDDAPSPLTNNYGIVTAVTANLAMKRETYEAAGGFASDLRGTEDCDITQKLLVAGATYLIVLDWVIEHIAKNTYRETRRRFRGYGLQGAYFVVSRKSWRHSTSQIGGSFREILTSARWQFGRELAHGEKWKLPITERWLRALMRGLLLLEYGLGWRTGLRKQGIKSRAELPRYPALAERYVDFSQTDADALAMR